MGHPRKARKKYDTPSHPWNADRIKQENKLVQKYGLKNKKEVWKAETMVKRYRRDARELLGITSEHNSQERDQLLGHLIKLGILPENAKLEAVLDLTVEDVLRRRLQTVVHRKGLAYTAKEARVFVVHGHIAMNNKKIDSPSYLVKRGEEELIGYYPGSAVIKLKIPENPKKEKPKKERPKRDSYRGRGRRNRR
ncbi:MULTISPECIES: 30S ribosomal protein S4 [Methanobacterium]|jgi:small subunit ribosomal protein S4|uniref:Small ribosomal subunit protein uS4 n=1 Tax=Methanobacterium subterraneum TaxID=59277 RepID=A0A2H4VPL9_9EURY|nr:MULTISPECIES: 30S ribosomal protein S4 [Methanobacterium]MBW4257752.1 30S ribosomal protein S4 [Methanobacterium sp. YSL]AUB56080.1 30S ribosomal protein S4 [Methanobacterium subterraneum]AUB56889.1 30S ribosomal protein S4 [Methanobacterium sp. MZ-A1]AUB60045.1 30S ribosomal protein S4 [Methanobacterium subterraneum]MCC7560244.1 30S ribosomal protein S4 [Methanobacterium sp.]